MSEPLSDLDIDLEIRGHVGEARFFGRIRDEQSFDLFREFINGAAAVKRESRQSMEHAQRWARVERMKRWGAQARRDGEGA